MREGKYESEGGSNIGTALTFLLIRSAQARRKS